MKSKFLFLNVLLISFLVVFATSCNPKELYERSNYDDSICPDQYIVVNEAYLSSGIDENGIPVNITNIFTSDTPVIYFTFELSGDLCCIELTVAWTYEGDMFGEVWSEDGSKVSTPFTVALYKPENSFPKGNYTVTFYSTIWGSNIPFTVE